MTNKLRPAKAKPLTLNVRAEAKRLRANPIDALLKRIVGSRSRSPFVIDDIGRCLDAYEFYALTLARYYEGLSLGYRWRRSAYFALKYRTKYTAYERRLANRYNRSKYYLELDFFNSLLHARILLDRTIGLARYFLPKSGEQPSFTSFADHKKFFTRRTSWHSVFQDYADHFRNETGWFDELKNIRDKILVHQGPKHSRWFGYPFEHTDLSLSIMFPLDEAAPLRGGTVWRFSIRDMATEIDRFLHWFSRRGMRALRLQARAQPNRSTSDS
jgi:hypothetical protein